MLLYILQLPLRLYFFSTSLQNWQLHFELPQTNQTQARQFHHFAEYVSNGLLGI